MGSSKSKLARTSTDLASDKSENRLYGELLPKSYGTTFPQPHVDDVRFRQPVRHPTDEAYTSTHGRGWDGPGTVDYFKHSETLATCQGAGPPPPLQITGRAREKAKLPAYPCRYENWEQELQISASDQPEMLHTPHVPGRNPDQPWGWKKKKGDAGRVRVHYNDADRSVYDVTYHDLARAHEVKGLKRQNPMSMGTTVPPAHERGNGHITDPEWHKRAQKYTY